jgi:Polyphosphate kinase 2 (PPK2)
VSSVTGGRSLGGAHQQCGRGGDGAAPGGDLRAGSIPFRSCRRSPGRNRDKWPAYVQAVGDMVDRTSTEYAPWTLVEAEDKGFARVKVLRPLCERIEAAL